MKKIIIASILSLINLGLFAQEKFLKDINETQELSIKIASLFNQNEIPKIFEELSVYWPLPKKELESLEKKTIENLNYLGDRFGKSVGILKVRNETISDIAIRETYLVRYTNSAIRIMFTYYKNKNGWIVNAFKWDDAFDDEFK